MLLRVANLVLGVIVAVFGGRLLLPPDEPFHKRRDWGPVLLG